MPSLFAAAWHSRCLKHGCKRLPALVHAPSGIVICKCRTTSLLEAPPSQQKKPETEAHRLVPEPQRIRYRQRPPCPPPHRPLPASARPSPRRSSLVPRRICPASASSSAARHRREGNNFSSSRTHTLIFGGRGKKTLLLPRFAAGAKLRRSCFRHEHPLQQMGCARAHCADYLSCVRSAREDPFPWAYLPVCARAYLV